MPPESRLDDCRRRINSFFSFSFRLLRREEDMSRKRRTVKNTNEATRPLSPADASALDDPAPSSSSVQLQLHSQVAQRCSRGCIVPQRVCHLYHSGRTNRRGTGSRHIRLTDKQRRTSLCVFHRSGLKELRANNKQKPANFEIPALGDANLWTNFGRLLF